MGEEICPWREVSQEMLFRAYGQSQTFSLRPTLSLSDSVFFMQLTSLD